MHGTHTREVNDLLKGMIFWHLVQDVLQRRVVRNAKLREILQTIQLLRFDLFSLSKRGRAPTINGPGYLCEILVK